MPNTSKYSSSHVPSSASLPDAEYVKSAEFLEAMAAACAMIAWSDGQISAEERHQFFVSVRSYDSLSVFSPAEIIEEFALHEQCFMREPEAAFALAEHKLQQIVGRPQVAKEILHNCRLMIVADGFAYRAEFGALHKIRSILGLRDDEGGLPFSTVQSRMSELSSLE